ncbi:hypothetical protein [Bradyrhizobium sp. NP1]|uniref:hypothetical protein n=1 Tax=Bradyrhizobium sp. NP1 TaxID=3049772 RepID=UPI0025A584FC|nr:hypothetical protein [Bradyrhizobium sp. NP1]WJR78765.1 hypothetical protein QOU61_02850 [Bradyrhizobium sp. NP1]
MPETKAKTSGKPSHWAGVSDDRLIDLDLEIDNPQVLEGLVTQVPANYADAHVEFKYDLRGMDVPEFACVHGSHKHKAGFVMNVDGARFMVGWICAKTIYDEDFDKYTADFEAAIGRRDALRRVREMRSSIAQFADWLDRISSSNVLQAFSTVSDRLRDHMPWVFETLQRANGARIEGAPMPKHLCLPPADVRAEFDRLMNATAAVTMSLTGDAQRVAASIGLIRTEIDGLIRRAELILAKLSDLELFFQPVTLHAICQHAEKAVPRRKRHFAGLMKLSTRDVFVEMPKDFVVPSAQPLEALRAAAAGIVPVSTPLGPTMVSVFGKPYAVSTRQKSKSVWVATGYYEGTRHSAEDRTEGAAVKQWQIWAEYRDR